MERVKEAPAPAKQTGNGRARRDRHRRWAAKLLRSGDERVLVEALRSADGATIDLPNRAAVERRIGLDVGEVPVRTGPQIAALLEAADAEAATVDGTVYLPSPDAGVETLTHEVVHVLQSRHGSGPTLPMLPESHPAEVEAEQIAATTDDSKERHIDEGLSPRTLALSRSATLPRTADVEQEARADFDAGLGARTVAPPAQREPDGGRKAPDQDAGSVDRTSEATPEAGAAADTDGVGVPKLGEPEEPAAEPSPELAAQAEEALAAEGPPSAVIAAYRDATPSVKAAMQPALGRHLDDRTRRERDDTVAGARPIVVTVNGDQAIPALPAVRAPGQAADTAATEYAGALPTVELPPTPAPEPYRGNDGVVGKLGWFEPGDARAVGESLDSVQTTDPDIERDPGPPPTVPRTGAADDRRMAEQRATTLDSGTSARQAATQAVIDGPGPEVVTPQDIEEQRSLEEPAAAQPGEVVPSTDAQAFTTLGLPDDVVAQFDADTDASMKAGVADAQSQMVDAETQRDTDRATAEEEAATEQDRIAGQADEDQRTAVVAARKEIQQERQLTIEAQDQAVADMDAEAGREHTARTSEIDTRRRQDEQKIDTEYKAAKKTADKKVAQGEKDAAAEKREAEEDAKNRSWWDRAVSFVKKAFAALTAVIGAVFKAVRAAVTAVLNAAKAFAKAIVDAAVSFVSGLIDAFASLVKSLLKNVLGKIFPELAAKLSAAVDRLANRAKAAVKAVGDAVKKGIDAVVGALQAAVNKVLDVFEAALQTVVSIVSAALTGDWGEVLRQVLEAALKVVGISPESFYAFIGKAMDTIGLIVKAPGRFLGNAVDTVVGGIKLFASNFLKHLKAGIIGWLTGALGGALQIPETFNLAGVLSIIRQILGLTWEWLRKKAAKLIGEKNVARLEFIWSYIDTLRTEGWAGLFNQIKEQLTGLKDTVLDAIKEMLVTKVVIAAVTWVASLFNPVGALVKLVMLIWNLYTFIRDQLARVWAMARAVISSISDIARGILDAAMKKVEEVLGNLLPVAIDLLAKLLGLGSFAGKVRAIIKKVQARVDKAVDKLLDKVLKRFKGKGSAGKGEADAAKSPSGQIGKPQSLTEADSSRHTLQIDVAGRDATVAVHSSPATPAARWISDYETNRFPKLDTEPQKKAKPHLDAAKAALKELDPDADALAASRAQGAKAKKAKATKKTPTPEEVLGEQKKLTAAIQALMRFGGSKVDISKFEPHLAKAHESAKGVLATALQALLAADTNKAKPLAEQPWETVRAKLIASEDPHLARPLLRASKFGTWAQDQLVEVVKTIGKNTKDSDEEAATARELADDEARKSLVSRYVAKPINDSAAGSDERTVVYDVMFDKTKAAGLAAKLTPAVRKGLADSVKGRGTDPNLIKAVKAAGGIIEFLTTMARNQKVSGYDIDPKNWDKTYSDNREYFKSAFRGVNTGQHEWIPTSLINEVVAHAQKGNSENAEIAVLWIEVHHELRSPTKGLIFKPELHSKEAKGPIGPSGKPTDWTVLQGHPGAVYAPLSGGRRTEVGKQQVEGSAEWHERLRENFRNASKLATTPGIQEAVLGAQASFDEMIWSGTISDRLSKNTEYRAGTTETELSFVDLRKTFLEKRKRPEFDLAEAIKTAKQAKPNV